MQFFSLSSITRLQGYKVYYTTNPNQPEASWDSQMVDNSELTTISELTPLAIYTVRVQAFTSMGAGPMSNPVKVKTQQGLYKWISLCLPLPLPLPNDTEGSAAIQTNDQQTPLKAIWMTITKYDFISYSHVCKHNTPNAVQWSTFAHNSDNIAIRFGIALLGGVFQLNFHFCTPKQWRQKTTTKNE